MANIYEITQDLLLIQSMMDDPELDEQMLKDTMEAVEGEFEYKAEGYAKVMKNMMTDVDALREEAKRMTERATSIENNIKRMKTILYQSMKATGKTKFKGEKFSFWVQKNPVSTIVEINEKELPTQYQRVKVEADLGKIREAIESGADLSGIAHLEQTEGVRFK